MDRRNWLVKGLVMRNKYFLVRKGRQIRCNGVRCVLTSDRLALAYLEVSRVRLVVLPRVVRAVSALAVRVAPILPVLAVG